MALADISFGEGLLFIFEFFLRQNLGALGVLVVSYRPLNAGSRRSAKAARPSLKSSL